MILERIFEVIFFHDMELFPHIHKDFWFCSHINLLQKKSLSSS